MKNISKISTWFFFSISLFLFSIGLSWQINKTMDFFYPTLYETLEINAHIKTYAPQNNSNKSNFTATNKQQHIELFSVVVYEIHNHGENLHNIEYRTSRNNSTKLFTEAEVIHLQDVANLIDLIRVMWLINFLPLLISYYYIRKTKMAIPSFKVKIGTYFSLVTVVVLLFSVLGFKKIFYYFHTLVFPDNHQWFFYYQESLMSTFMKAPDLFAFIGLIIFIIGLTIFFLFNFWLLSKLHSNNAIRTE